MSNQTKPYPNSYWIQNGVFLAGEYPGATSRGEAQAKLTALLDAGINCFIDLTEPGELVPYDSLLRRLAAGRGISVEHHRHPIRDVSTPNNPGDMVDILDRIDSAISAGRKVYVHCWGGTGRTGTVVGCHQVRGGLEGQAALERVHMLWSDMAKAPNRPHGSPETEAQRAYVRQWREPSREETITTETSVLTSTLEALTAETAQNWENLTVVPLVAEGPRTSAYVTMAEAAAEGRFRVTEVSAGGSVPDLLAVNDGLTPVLLLDGEELLGAKQHRIVNLSILVPANATVRIPVSCVEQGRWSRRSDTFRESDRTLFAEARARKARDVNQSYSRGSRHTNQGELWKHVRDRLDTLGVASPTLAMSDGYEATADALAGCVDALDVVPGQVGAAFAINGRIAGVEVFDSCTSFRHYYPKVVRSYALDALADRVDGPASDVDAQVALDELANADVRRYPAVGLGEDQRLEDDGLTGGALVNDGQVVHLAAFWTDPRPNGVRSPSSNRTWPRDNHDLLRETAAQGHLRIEPSGLPQAQPTRPETTDLWDRVEGMLLGLAVGDSLGNTSEGLNPDERKQRVGEVTDYLPNRHAEWRPVGLPSDDTQLAFWTLRRLNEDRGLDPEALLREFSSHQVFGIGGTVRGALRRFARGHRNWREAGLDSAGNGALMRIAPVLIPHLNTPTSGLWVDTALATMITHNDRAAIASSVAFIALLWELMSRSGAPESEWWIDTVIDSLRAVEGSSGQYRTRTPHVTYDGPLWRFTEEQVRSALARSAATAEACNHWYSGAYLLETVPSLLYILCRHGHDPEQAILRAVNDTRDSDSLGAMVGAAVGALHGRKSLPDRWIQSLPGRTESSDDGAIFRLLGETRTVWRLDS